jgi:hypothetical protein
MSIAQQIRESIERLENIQLQEQQDQEILEALILESSLSKLVGKLPGGQSLVRHLHRQHLLSNDAEYVQQPWRGSKDRGIYWKQFKNDPDNFLIFHLSNGVAGVRPDPEMIRAKQEAARLKGKEYKPENDTSLLYRVISYNGENEAVRLQAQKDEPMDHPELMKGRGGLPKDPDIRNPDNIFNQLKWELGDFIDVYMTKKAIEREKLAQRAEYKQPSDKRGEFELSNAIFAKLKPVLPKIIQQAGMTGAPDASTLREKFKLALYKASGVQNPQHLNSKGELVDFLRGVAEGNVQDLQKVLNALRVELRQP